MKFFLDGDQDSPTIASTGTEDYFLGSYNFWVNQRYQTFTTPYSGPAAGPSSRTGPTRTSPRAGSACTAGT